MKRVGIVLVGLLAALAFAAAAFATQTKSTYCNEGKTVSSSSTEYVAGHGFQPWGVTFADAAEAGGYYSYATAIGTWYTTSKQAVPFWAGNPTFHPVTVGACPAAETPPPPEANVFLCYSAFQSDPGVWPISEAAALVKAGYWSPYAVPNTVSGATNVGGYHLVCNLATGQSAGTSVLGGAGEMYGMGATKDVTNVPGHYSVVGP